MATGKIEKITNDSGDGYCKMPDGTLIQWGITTITSGATSGYVSPINTAYVPIQFPIPFASTVYYVSGCAKWYTGAAMPAVEDLGTETTTSCGLRWIDAAARTFSATYPLTVRWLAIGRWK